MLQSLQVMKGNYPYTIQRARLSRPGYLLLVKTAGREREIVTELIAQWALHEAFYLIAAGEWLPDHDDVRYAVYRYTTAIEETLSNLTLARPFTCFQLLDLLLEAGAQHKPILILDFLHLFHDDDVELFVRQRILEGCCQSTKRLALTSLVAVLVPTLSTEAYRRFFPILAAMADEILETEKVKETQFIQDSLF